MCLTDKNCDMGYKAEQNGFGAWALSDGQENFEKLLNVFLDKEKNITMGNNGYQYFCDNYDVEKVYPIIINKLGENI